MDRPYEVLLRRLAVLDERTVGGLLPGPGEIGATVDARTTALVRLAALVAAPSSPQTYEWCAAAALTAGCTEDDVVAVLAAVAPVVGVARVSTAAVNIAVAFGCHDVPSLD